MAGPGAGGSGVGKRGLAVALKELFAEGSLRR